MFPVFQVCTVRPVSTVFLVFPSVHSVPNVASVHPPGSRFPSSQAGGSGLDAGCAGLIEEIVKSEQAICHQKYHQHHQQYRRYQQKHHHHHQQQPHQHQANTLSGRDLRQG